MKKTPSNKLGKDISELGNKKISSNKLLAEVSVVGFNVYAIVGQIVEETKTGIVFRYKKPGSKNIVREIYSYPNIVALHKQGSSAVLWVKTNRTLFTEHCVGLKTLDSGLLSLTNLLGEEVIVNPNNVAGFETSVKFTESEESDGKPKTRESKRQTDMSLDEEIEEKPKTERSKEERKLIAKKKKKFKA
jgi:hypothetical protein